MADEKVKTILDRRRESMDYYAPIHDQFVEVQRAAKCMTLPILKKNKADQEVEDKSRTNVAMPIISIAHRKNVARLTTNSPKIGFVSQKNPDLAERLTSWAYWQYDMTDESETLRSVVSQGELFGKGIAKCFMDDVTVRRKMRVPIATATREQALQAKGIPPEQIQQEVAAFGPDLKDEERIVLSQEFGAELNFDALTKKYSGPVAKALFIGDVHFPPHCQSIEKADWILEECKWTAADLEYWADKKYVDPDSGEELPILDAEAVDEMLKSDPSIADEKERKGLRDRFAAISKLDTDTFQKLDPKLRSRKQWNIIECHERDEKGRIWVWWVCESYKDKPLGKMVYPIDTYGNYLYVSYDPLSDFTSVYGDSTPRLGRFLYRMLNAAVAQAVDLISNILRPLALVRRTADIEDEAADRSLLKELKVNNPADVQIERIQDAPGGAWENINLALRLWGMLEPATFSADLAGTNSNPQTGRTATVGVLAQRERDTILQYKIDALNIFLKKLYRLKLWMLQQTLTQPITMGAKYQTWKQQQPEAISERYGEAAVIKIDWQEIQEDIQVEPEAGSTLSIDDEFHRMAAQTLYQAAAADPETFDKFYAAQKWAERVPGVDARKAVKLPQPPPEPPPKVQFNVNVPLDKMPADITNQILQKGGLEPSQELQHRDTLDAMVKVGEAADGVAKLAEPVATGDEAKPGNEATIRRTAADRA